MKRLWVVSILIGIFCTACTTTSTKPQDSRQINNADPSSTRSTDSLKPYSDRVYK